MNNKGFTLIEIISTLVILALIGIVIGINLNKIFNSNENAEYNRFLKMIESTADIYVSGNSEIKDSLNTSKGYYIITVSDLQASGLLDTDLINPKTNKTVDSNTLVKISMDANGVISYEVDPEILDESYLYAKNLVLSVEDKHQCNSYQGEYGSETLYLVTKEGNIDRTLTHDEVIISAKCNFNSSIPGTYNIIYLYKELETGKEKSVSRKITIYSDLINTTELNADMDFDISAMVFLMYDNTLNYTLSIKNNSDYQRNVIVKDILAMNEINNGNLLINTKDTNIKRDAEAYFSISGLNASLEKMSQITFTFPLQVKAQAGSTISYQASYTINTDGNSQSSQTPKKEVDVEKNISINEVNAIGVNVAMVLDVSGSMNSTRMKAMKNAANAFIDAQNLVASKICIISFATNPSLKGCSQNSTTLKSYVNGLSASGGTYYGKALTEAQKAFNKQFNEFPVNDDFLVFLSDGSPSDSNYTSTLNSLKNSGVTIYTIALAGENTKLKNMASSTKGYYSTTTGNLSEAFMNISTMINSGETISTKKGVAEISDKISTTKPVEFLITAENGTTNTLVFNNINDAIDIGYIILDNNKYKINAIKFKASDKILFSYYVN